MRNVYKEHEGKHYYDRLMASVNRGVVAVHVCVKEPRHADAAAFIKSHFVGNRDPKIAKKEDPPTLRTVFAGECGADNGIHCSDNFDAAVNELITVGLCVQ
jgi:nucleoside diphosphate kinase